MAFFSMNKKRRIIYLAIVLLVVLIALGAFFLLKKPGKPVGNGYAEDPFPGKPHVDVTGKGVVDTQKDVWGGDESPSFQVHLDKLP